MTGGHGDQIEREFRHQAESFNRAPALLDAVTTTAILDVVPIRKGSRWLDVACGTGIMTRHLAARAGTVVGLDMTESMLEVARRETAAAGIDSITYVTGDATRMPFPDGEFDGAFTRFSLHHIPVPGRVVNEMARVVRPGGTVAVADHLGSAIFEPHRRHLQVERLRDPSHWDGLTRPDLAALGRAAGLRRRRRAGWDFDLDFEEWLQRGSGGPGNRVLIEALLAEGEADPYCRYGDGKIGFRLGIYVWQKRP